MGARTITPPAHEPHLPLGVVAAGLAEGLGEDGDGRVDGVRDDADERLGAGVGDGLGEGRADAGVDLEEVVTGHAGLAGNTSGDDDNVGTGKGLLGTVVGGEEALNGSGGVDVREVGSNTLGVDDIVERELSDRGVELEEERERLADTTWGLAGLH
jgi:hypothetical protein